MSQLVWLAHNKSIKRELRVEGIALHIHFWRCGNGAIRRGRSRGGTRGAAADLKAQTVSLQAVHVQLVQNSICIVGLDIVAHKSSWNSEGGNAIIKTGKTDRLDPGFIIVLTDSLRQRFLRHTPRLLRHSILPLHFSKQAPPTSAHTATTIKTKLRRSQEQRPRGMPNCVSVDEGHAHTTYVAKRSKAPLFLRY